MTDDNSARYRATEPFSSRTVGPDGQASDPLAELARLIGQTDLFAEREREARAAAEARAASYEERDLSYGAEQQPAPYSDPARYDAQYAAEAAPSQPDWHSLSATTRDAFAAALHQTHSQAHDAPAAGDSHYQDLADVPHAAHSEFDLSAQPQHGFDAASLDAALRREPDFPPPLAFSSDAGSLPPPPADELYDDAPPRRRKGMLTVAAVLCLAVMGTAAAFGYRTYFTGASAKSPPPVIRASAEPNKVAPPPQQQADAAKISYDRFGDRSKNEKVVVREEKPVDIKTAPSRTPAVAPALAAAPAAPAAATPPSVLTEPKRVRTVPIRPDGPDTVGGVQMPAQVPAQVAAQLPAQIPAQVPAPARQAVAAAPSNAPLNLANPVAPPAPTRSVAPPPAPRAAAPSANAPLSLSPDANAAAPPRSAPTRVASAPAGNGSYLVQVASQRSEADAQAAFRSIRSKYSNVLGDRQLVIRRADLAGRGTYYRAMVGPFSTRDQAVQLCSSLKAAGGDCVVQAN